MTTTTDAHRIEHVPDLRGQIIVVIGGSSGIGLETARRTRGEGADLILGARDANPSGARRTRGRGTKHIGVRRDRSARTRALLRGIAGAG